MDANYVKYQVTVAAAAAAYGRYAGTDWAEDHAQTAALNALIAMSGGDDVIAPYKPKDGKDSLYFLVSYVLGVALGNVRRAAAVESEASLFSKAFSDFSDEDPESLIDALAMDVFVPAYDAADATFVGSNGVNLTMSEVAEELRSRFGTEDFNGVYDALVLWAQEQDYVEFNSEPEPEPEPVEIRTVIKDLKTGAVKSDTIVATKVINTGYLYNPTDEGGPTYDLVYEEYAARTSDGDPYEWDETINPDVECDRNVGLIRQIATEYIEGGDWDVTVQDWVGSLDINQRSVNRLAYEIGSRVNAIVKEPGLTGYIARMAGAVSYEEDEETSYAADSSLLRQNIIDAVFNGEMFASQGCIAMAKVNGLHSSVAKTIGQEVFDASVNAKSVVRQRRFSYVTEAILAEKIYAVFELDLPKTLVGIVGKVDIEKVKNLVANITEYAIVGGEQARGVANELGVRFVDLRAHKDYVDEQTIVSCDVAIAGTGRLGLSRVREYARKLGKPLRVAL